MISFSFYYETPKRLVWTKTKNRRGWQNSSGTRCVQRGKVSREMKSGLGASCNSAELSLINQLRPHTSIKLA